MYNHTSQYQFLSRTFYIKLVLYWPSYLVQQYMDSINFQNGSEFLFFLFYSVYGAKMLWADKVRR